MDYKIIFWNIDRQNRNFIDKAELLLDMDADFLVLTEYQPSRHYPIADHLASQYDFIEVFDPYPKLNGMLIASKALPIKRGKFKGPKHAPATLSHVVVPEIGLNLVGVRLLSGRTRQAHLGDQLAALKEGALDKLARLPCIIGGDLNISLDRQKSTRGHRAGQEVLNQMLNSDWRLPTIKKPIPTYYSRSLKTTSTIDYSLFSSALTSREAQLHFYKKYENYKIAGSKDSLSDHAILELSVDT